MQNIPHATTSKIAPTAVIAPHVILGKNVVIEDFCLIGLSGPTDQQTVIGDFAIIRSHTVIYSGNIIGNYFQTGHKANLRECNRIGQGVSIGTMSVVEHHVVIEDEVRIHSQAFIPEFSHLKKKCWIGPNVVLTNAKYPQSENAKKNLEGCEIGEEARIGANSTLLPGIRIGAKTLVGAGSVVTSSFEAGIIIAGNPARLLRKGFY